MRQIDREGVESLGIRTLATELGVAPNSLYSYVRDKDDLVRGAIALLFANATVPRQRGKSWRDRIRETCCWFRRELLRHPNVVAAPAFRETYPFAFFPVLYAMGEILQEAGFEDRELVDSIFALSYHTTGFTTLEVARGRHGIAAKSNAFIIDRLERDLDEEDTGEAGRLLPLAREVDLESVFERSLDSILEGIAANRRPALRRVPGGRPKRTPCRR